MTKYIIAIDENKKMSLNDFSVGIIVNNELITSEENGHVYLQDEDEYNISLTNKNKLCRCDAEIKIDNILVGHFHIGTDETFIIERPSKINNHFKFVNEKSSIVDEVYGDAAVQKRESVHNGKISVTFRPEYEPTKCNEEYELEDLEDIEITYDDEHISHNKSPTPSKKILYNDLYNSNSPKPDGLFDVRMGNDNDITCKKEKVGMTVLSNKLSKQTFKSVSGLCHDLSKATTINLRLVSK
jgi:hypothetical protein